MSVLVAAGVAAGVAVGFRRWNVSGVAGVLMGETAGVATTVSLEVFRDVCSIRVAARVRSRLRIKAVRIGFGVVGGGGGWAPAGRG